MTNEESTTKPKHMPDRELEGTDGLRRLRPISGRNLVIAFYQEDGTPGCTTELNSFKKDFPTLVELDAEVVGVSTDDLNSHVAFRERIGGLPFPLLSDRSGELAQELGIWDSESRRARRAAFVVDASGTIVHAATSYNPANLDDYARVFAALGFAE